MKIPGKKRGYIQLRFKLDGWRITASALRSAELVIAVSKIDAGSDPCPQAVTIDLGGPSRMDKWAPKIAKMRSEGVPWRTIGELTGLGSGNAYNAWKRYVDAQEDPKDAA